MLLLIIVHFHGVTIEFWFSSGTMKHLKNRINAQFVADAVFCYP